MEKIASFMIDHTKLNPGLYVSRKDKVGDETITTFDLRLTYPNQEAPMRTDEIHAIEHLAASYLRSDSKWKDKILYFGPMGCRTGFYLIVAGDYSPSDVIPVMVSCFQFIAYWAEEIPGATAVECGNYLDMNLDLAKFRSHLYLYHIERADDNNTVYPK